MSCHRMKNGPPPPFCKTSWDSKPNAQLSNRPWALGPASTSWSLKFRPWFVDKAFWKWHQIYHLSGMDGVCLVVDACIALITSLALLPLFSWRQLFCFVAASINLLLAHTHAAQPEFYARRRLALHAFRRLMILLQLRLVVAPKQPHSSSTWQVVVWHMLLQPGALEIAALALFFMEPWPIAAAHSAVAVLFMGSSCIPACGKLLTQPQPATATGQVAWLLDKAAAGVYRRSLLQPELAAAGCQAAVNTLQVLFACASVCAVYWIERCYRLRYKAQLPPVVAAMQPHIYGLPWYLCVAEAVLLVLYPTLVLTWVIAGYWHGL